MTHFYLHGGKLAELLMNYSGTLCPILAGVNSKIKQAMSKPCEMLLGKGSESKLCRAKSSEAWVAS